jgi:2-polyprenyl-3-methyl-5-hydroxy-6-metoxy-1,4-benzoquinol methylase
MTEAVHEAHRSCVCPWWLMQFFDHRVRALFQPTAPVVKSLVVPGSQCLDMGCGMGFFSVPMALQAGSTGHVTGVDIQSRMLEGAARRAKQEGLAERISLRLATDSDWVLPEHYDFILAFWMLHEVPDRRSILETLRKVLKSNGRFLLVEPKLHVSAQSWEKSLALAGAGGFRSHETYTVKFSRAALMH